MISTVGIGKGMPRTLCFDDRIEPDIHVVSRRSCLVKRLRVVVVAVAWRGSGWAFYVGLVKIPPGFPLISFCFHLLW